MLYTLSKIDRRFIATAYFIINFRMNLSNKALLASALSVKCSFMFNKLRFYGLRAASK